MKKLIFIIIILIICNLISYKYLSIIHSSRKALTFDLPEKVFILPINDLVIYEGQEYDENSLFEFLSFSDIAHSYLIDDNSINIMVDNKKYSFPYVYKAKEVITVEKIVYKEINKKVEIKENKEDIPTVKENSIQESNTSNNTLKLSSKTFSYPLDTDVGKIINDIERSIRCDSAFDIDYMNLNSSCEGNYTVYINSEVGNSEINVEIY